MSLLFSPRRAIVFAMFAHVVSVQLWFERVPQSCFFLLFNRDIARDIDILIM